MDKRKRERRKGRQEEKAGQVRGEWYPTGVFGGWMSRGCVARRELIKENLRAVERAMFFGDSDRRRV